MPTVAETLATGLRSPWGLAFLPDGGALVSERDTARVLRVSPAGTTSVVGTVPDVVVGGEGGLLGLAVSPSFAQDRWVYAYHSAPGENRVVRLRLQDGALGPPQVLLDGIPAASIHNGGRIAFGPDGMLYVGTGDAADTARSPRPDTLAGKVLRLTPNGRVPSDNPDPASPIWTSGHRNVQGLAWGEDGTMWASEFGANTWDELNVIRPGGDYGWPTVEGGGGREGGFVDPVVQWPTDQASPSGIAVTADTVYVASLRGQRLWAVPVAGARAGEPVAFFTGELGRLRTVAAAPDGSLWLVTSNTDGRGVPGGEDDRILRLTLAGG
ncbi:MAG: PQQ-dependent sugar dehydrogenase [Acidimicrobiales bacterium]|nr:PQQ-dependent sugar dehydrogenase [Acidimicrobiales bacterium]